MHQLPGHVGHHHHHQHDACHDWGVKEGRHYHHQQEVGQVQHAALKHLQLVVCSDTKQPQVVMVGQVQHAALKHLQPVVCSDTVNHR